MAAAAAAMVSSASGLLAMLNEQHPRLKLHALSNLNALVHLFWPEISTSVPTIESLYEDEEFDQRQLAALVVSKVFNYLGELNDSLSYALGAGPLFDVSEDSDYVHTLLAKAIDEYASFRSRAAESNDEAMKVDPRLEAIVERMLDKCIMDGKYQQAMGIALECRRLDKLEGAITSSDNVHGMLSYCINISHSFVNRREYRCEVRTILDIECGFGSFGAHLFSLNLMTICIAAYEVFGSQVQLALERGLPAMIGSFTSKQLPHPSLSFDMVHCAQCGITWDAKDGAFLIEVDRVLKPGGYFVLTSPTSKPLAALANGKSGIMFTAVEDFTQKICWNLLAQQDETFIWQKTADVNCYASRKQGAVPVPLCNNENDVESYYQPLVLCISGTTSKRWIPMQNRSYSPADFQLSFDKLAVHGVHPDDFQEDSHVWSLALKNYWSLLTPLIFSDHPKRPGDEDPLPPFNMIRNVMDMNAHYGGLNAAFLVEKKPVWVMNVVPFKIPSTLPLILDRGFAGVLHDWCEPFPTYPRTYDMLHGAGILSQILDSGACDIMRIFLEMDRILRPEGWVILRDEAQVIKKARIFAQENRWDARVIELQNENDQRLLVCQKPFLKK